MGTITSPFARIKASLTPLLPEPAPVDASGLDNGQIPAFPSAPAPKVTLAPFDPKTASPEDVAMRPALARLRSDEEKDLRPWGFQGDAAAGLAPNHPGFWGKFGHALSVATGGPNRRQFEEMGLAKSLQDVLNSQSRNELEGAQTKEAETRAEAGEPHEVSPMLAAALGVPELEGQMLPASAITALEKQHGINVTKEKTNTETVQGRENVANQNAIGRESVANINAANKIQPHITVMKDGQPHVMERDPASGQYSIDRGVAPPNYAQVLPEVLATKTTEMLGDDGVMHRYQFDPKTNTYSEDIGAAPTGTAAHQIFQGSAIENLAPQIIADINANREILGNLSSYYKQWLAGTPVSDPRAAQLMTELMSFAAMQPALHAFRSTNALQAFEKIVGELSKNPDSTIATINGLLKTPEAFTSLPRSGTENRPSNNQQLPGTGKVFDSEKWAKANPNGDVNAAKKQARAEGYEVR